LIAFLTLDMDVRKPLQQMIDQLGDARTGHLLPIPREMVDAYNSEGPLATDDPGCGVRPCSSA
jgi:hypothetical protein